MISVEINGVFYKTIKHAGKNLKHTPRTIKDRCLSDNYPNYKIVPFRITYTKKRCTVCGDIKSVDEFNEYKKHKDGLTSQCKKCLAKYAKKYRKNNPEKEKEATKKWRKNNSEYYKEWHKKWRKNNPEYYKELQKKKRENDPIYKLNVNISSAIRGSLRTGKNGRHWEKLVDYTLKELMAYLESLFLPGMTWENHGIGRGKWNIDHIIPTSLFNITSTKCRGFKACWELENLRPMWSEDNLRKNNKLFY